MKRRDYPQSRTIKLGGSPNFTPGCFYSPGGTRPYIWFGDSHGHGIGYIDDLRRARALYKLLRQYIESRGAKP